MSINWFGVLIVVLTLFMYWQLFKWWKDIYRSRGFANRLKYLQKKHSNLKFDKSVAVLLTMRKLDWAVGIVMAVATVLWTLFLLSQQDF